MGQDSIKNYKAIVIGGSAGSFPVITEILSNLPKGLNIPVILCLHRLKHIRHGFMEALNLKSKFPVQEPEDKERIWPGKVYLAPYNYHLYIELGYTFALSTEEMVKYSRPSIDLTFETASYVYRDKLIGIILSGANSDGANGIKKIKERGGLTIVQDPKEASMATMPEAALKNTEIDLVYSTKEIINFLNKVNVGF